MQNFAASSYPFTTGIVPAIQTALSFSELFPDPPYSKAVVREGPIPASFLVELAEAVVDPVQSSWLATWSC